MKLILIRHGLTDGLEQHLYYGATNLPVNEKGIEELKRLRAEIDYPQAECYYTTGMLRTEQTFELIYGQRDHGVIPQMREMNFGAFEMRHYEELKHDPLYQQWLKGDYTANIAPGGESYRLMGERCVGAAEKLVAKGHGSVVVCHGGPISAIMIHYFGGDNPYTYIPSPGRGYTIEFEDGKAVSFEKL